MNRSMLAIRVGLAAVLIAPALPALSATAAASAPATKTHAHVATAPASAASASTKKKARRDPGLNQPGPAGNRGPTPGVAGNAGPGR